MFRRFKTAVHKMIHPVESAGAEKLGDFTMTPRSGCDSPDADRAPLAVIERCHTKPVIADTRTEYHRQTERPLICNRSERRLLKLMKYIVAWALGIPGSLILLWFLFNHAH